MIRIRIQSFNLRLGLLLLILGHFSTSVFSNSAKASPGVSYKSHQHTNSIDLHQKSTKVKVNNQILVLEDPTHQLSIDDILDTKNQEYFVVPTDTDSLNIGYSNSAYWIKLSLRNITTDTKTWWYQLDLPLLDESVIYILPHKATSSERSIYKRQLYDTPLSEREISHVTTVYPITLKAEEKVDVYLQLKSKFSIHLPLYLYTPEGFVDSVAIEEMMYGWIIGAILIMIAYNTFMFISVQERTFLYYVLYMSFYLVFLVTERVHGLEMFGDIPPFFHKDNLYIYIWCSWFFALMLGRSFLDTKEHDPDLDSIAKLFVSFTLISLVVSPLLDISTSLQWAVFGTIPYSVFMVWFAYIGKKRGNPFANFYLMSWFLNFAGVSIYAFVVSGYLPFNFATSNSPHFGILCQMIIISFALADRIKVMQRRAAIASHQSLVNLRRYRSLFDNAVEGIFRISLDRRFLDVNAAMVNMLGFSTSKELVTTTVDAFDACYQNPEDKQRVISEIERGKPVIEFEATYKNTNQQSRWASSTMRIIYDKEDKPSHLEGTFIDITERMERAQDRFEKNIAEASAAAKSRFLANMSHEIRTPLTAIIGYGESLLDDSLSEKAKRESSEIVVKSGKHLLALVNDILDHSKIDAEQMMTEKLYVDLIPLFSDVKSFFAPKAAEKNIEFHIRYEYPLPSKIETDPMRFKQILINLCSNALKFTERGSITMTARLLTSSSHIEVDILDTGIGLKPEQIDALFDPFAQATPSIARQHGGTGLGLSISKSLSEMLGGSIKVESKYGEGSKFTVSIATGDIRRSPLLHNASDIGAITSTSYTVTVPDVTGKILYAEDNELNSKLVEQLVRKTKASIKIVSNGAKALELVTRENEEFELILMDIQMPVMDGRDATAAIRAAGINTPIIAVTANVMEEDVEEYIEAGCTEIMAKPIHKQAFYEVLSRYLPPARNLEQAKPDVPIPDSSQFDTIHFKDKKLKKVYGTVLVADDNEINCRLISLYLTKIGVKIVLAQNGEQAVKQALENNVDLIIMDQHMPNLEGPEAIQELRSRGFVKPILAFTASDDLKDKSLMKEAGCNGTVDKPIVFEQLYRSLNEHLHIDRDDLSASPTPWQDPDLVPIISQFIRDLPQFMSSLQEAFEAQDWKTIRELAHQVIGMAGSLGFNDVAESAKSVELALKKGKIKGFKKLIETFVAEAEKAEDLYRHA